MNMTPEQIKALQEENAKLKADLTTEQEVSKAFQDELSKKTAPKEVAEEVAEPTKRESKKAEVTPVTKKDLGSVIDAWSKE